MKYDNYKTTHLVCNPRGVALGCIACHVRLYETVLESVRGPVLFQELFSELFCFDSPGFPDDVPENMVVVLSLGPGQGSPLARTRNSTCEYLIDIDVFDASLVLVVLDGKGESAVVDCLALYPADSL